MCVLQFERNGVASDKIETHLFANYWSDSNDWLLPSKWSLSM